MKSFERKHRNNRSMSHTGVTPTLSKQSLMPHQIYPAICGVYRRLVHRSGNVIRRSGNVIRFFSHLVHWTLENLSLMPGMFAKV